MITNRLEIRVNGLQRSGNHAVVHWIASQTTGTCLVLSDARPGSDPFRTMSEFLVYEDGQVVRYVEMWDLHGPTSGRGPALIEYRDGVVVKFRRRLDRDSRFAALREVHPCRDVLIHSYEDRPLSGPDSTERGDLFGCSGTFHDVLVVRDPLNFFASRLKRWNCLSGLKDRQDLVALWKQHAAEALGMTSRLGPGRIVANFTRWAVDGDYRQDLARALGLTFSDKGRDSMMPGFSSSFDGTGYSTRADAMPVNERWKAFAGDPAFAEILNDSELRDMSNELFGSLEGWRSLG